MTAFKSITGVIVNDPTICIKGNGNFACICMRCGAERDALSAKLGVILELPEEARSQFFEKMRQVQDEFGCSEASALDYCFEGFGLTKKEAGIKE